MALYNRQPYNSNADTSGVTKPATITGLFSSLPSPPPLGATMSVRDVWSGEELGKFADSYTARNVPVHGTVFLRLTLTN